MIINSHDLQILCHIALDAGQEIMNVYTHGGEVVYKQDQSPLTQADLRSDAVISQGLQHAFPQWPVVSEETYTPWAIDAEEPNTFFLVDPLDGTKEFVNRNGEFTVNIALIHSGRPVAGVVFAPALNELFYGAQGVGVFKQDAQGIRVISTRVIDPNHPLRIMGSRSHGADRLNQWMQLLNRSYTFVAAGSSLKFCRIAEGSADMYPRFGPTSQWDTAAAQAVLELAGGCVTDLNGVVLSYGLKRPILNPDFIATSLAQARSMG